jgi:hypothetical protein
LGTLHILAHSQIKKIDFKGGTRDLDLPYPETRNTSEDW